MKKTYLSMLIITTAACLSIGCASNTKGKEVKDNISDIQKEDSDSAKKTPNLIGYDSLNIFLGSYKSDIDKLITLKWDKDNEPGSNLVKYYSPYQTISLEKLKGNLDLYFSFNKGDSTLRGFYASLIFDNYHREKIIPNIKSELLKKFSYVGDFSTEDISSGDDKVKTFNGYKVKIKLDTASYSTTFYYSIETTK
jgi:hypothetical protein